MFFVPQVSQGLSRRLALVLLAGTLIPAAPVVWAQGANLPAGVGLAVVEATISPFRQAVAAAAGGDTTLSSFYRDNDYQPLWTGMGEAPRRQAFFTALSFAGDQGLPVRRYDPAALARSFRAVRTEGDRGRLEVAMSRAFLRYARDVQTGVLTPSRVDPTHLVRKVPLRDPRKTIEDFATSAEPAAFLRALPPQSPDYQRLLKAKLDMERLIGDGGWGPQVDARKLSPGDTGRQVIALRNRLIAMGYLQRTAITTFDADFQRAVQLFQIDHGLTPDGVAGAGTIAGINVGPTERLKSIIVAMERLRWINMPLGHRHVWVNEADFSAKLYDGRKVTFKTRAVIGKNTADRQSPEFSNSIKFMVVNPTWNVPRSIMAREYLPKMQKNPNADSFLKLIDARGNTVNRANVDFSRYTGNNFPYDLKQPPSRSNALGQVKFMFPNKWNIYLHDTPSKSLFKRDVRAFSHGCIRLNDPFGLAYALLAPQTRDPRGTFHAALKTRVTTTINLAQPVPVHLVYFTAWPTDRGAMTYRNDVYGRDARVFAALARAGVALRAVQG